MKVISIQETDLGQCVRDAQKQRVVITRKGKPVAMVVSVDGLDLEQLELGHSDKFWNLVQEWRKQKPISREELERRLAEEDRKK